MNDSDYLQNISGIKQINDKIELKLKAKNLKEDINDTLSDEFLDFDDL